MRRPRLLTTATMILAAIFVAAPVAPAHADDGYLCRTNTDTGQTNCIVISPDGIDVPQLLRWLGFS